VACTAMCWCMERRLFKIQPCRTAAWQTRDSCATLSARVHRIVWYILELTRLWVNPAVVVVYGMHASQEPEAC
jgi:hypothetical protein